MTSFHSFRFEGTLALHEPLGGAMLADELDIALFETLLDERRQPGEDDELILRAPSFDCRRWTFWHDVFAGFGLRDRGTFAPCCSTRGVEVIDRIIAGRDRGAQVELLRELCDTMLGGSLCALGGMTPYPVLSALKYFPEDFGLPRETLPAAA
ncbi:NADH-ubiquinone oxidoreductase-F iron-sulfur binding region domain-containing protein [Mycobacterium tuberculosis]|uniref:NADH-ubiquinone oxidoreductase-F iron-sulfur binding region domain-containing protein n=1 Tax=Mycobacterium tuberculosis TaxID=1773 RepID=UPI00272C0731|nr:NADH-ubiquinone oxidoreductase-F iron-sulfur binding region domain-containing protein [Mycobacterium tuberculosis]